MVCSLVLEVKEKGQSVPFAVVIALDGVEDVVVLYMGFDKNGGCEPCGETETPGVVAQHEGYFHIAEVYGSVDLLYVGAFSGIVKFNDHTERVSGVFA